MELWRNASWYRDFIVSLVCFCLIVPPTMVVPIVVYADEIIDEANKGQDTGANLLLNYTLPTINNVAPLSGPLGPNELNIQELFPGYNDPTQNDPLSTLQSTPADLSTQGVAEQFTLQSGTGETAEAYQAIDAGALNPNAATIDMSTETFLDRSREIISGTDPILDEILTACAEDVTAGTPGIDTVTRLEDIWTCSQARQGITGNCTVDRNFVLTPVATQIVLTIVGGSCTPGADIDTWDDLGWGSLAVTGGADICHLLNFSGTPLPEWYLSRPAVPLPIGTLDYSPHFCGDFETDPPDAAQCSLSGNWHEWACRLAPPASLNAALGPVGTCATYPLFTGTVGDPVDYSGCNGTRIAYCQAVRDQYISECSASCPTGNCTASSGQDINDHGPLGWFAAVVSSSPNVAICMANPIGPQPPNWYATANLPAPISSNVTLGPGFCGDRTVSQPTAGECTPAANLHEHICRNELFNLNPSRGPIGACAGFEPAGYDAFVDPVDYTGCDADRIAYCTAVREEFQAECANTSCSGSCTEAATAAANIAIYNLGSTIFNNAGFISACRTWDQTFNVTSNPGFVAINGPGKTFSFAQEEQIDAGDYETRGWSTDVCGTVSSAGTCAGQGAAFESACNAASAIYPTPVGNVAAYCAAERAVFESNCNAANSCLGSGSVTGDEHWVEFGLAAPLPGQAGLCRVDLLEGGDWTVYPPQDGFNEFYLASGNFVDNDMVFGDRHTWVGKYCGTHQGRTEQEIIDACNVSGDQIENICRNTAQVPLDPFTSPGEVIDFSLIGVGNLANCVGGSVGPPFDYSTCPPGRQAVCQTARDDHVAACLGGGGSTPLMNGTETITAAALGLGSPVTLANQLLFGTSVDLVETGFNPSDYGLVAGEYVVSDHLVGGTGIDSSTIDDGGSYASDWDYTFTATVTDSSQITVEATLYQVVQNGFTFTGCSQADVLNVENGSCVGTVACTDYTPPCRVVDGVTVCEPTHFSDGITEVLSPWSDFTTAVPEMCWAADVTIEDCITTTNCIGNPSCTPDCDDLPPSLQAACLADPCWVDAQGNTVCLDTTAESWNNNLGDPGWIDDCDDLLARSECSLLPDIACIEGMEDEVDPTNVSLCYLRQRFFDCGSDVTVPGVPGADDVDLTCGAEFRCFGDECANTNTESNPDFIRAAVAATTVTESTKDMECDIVGDPTSCTIFEGTDNRCKDPRGSYLGIIPDCCAESRAAGASGGDFVAYMQLARYAYKIAKEPMVASYLAQSQILPSGLQNVIGAPAQIGRSVGRAVVSGFNSALEWAGFSPVSIGSGAAASAQSATAASVTGFGPIQQFVAQGVNNFLNGIGANQFASNLFATTSEGIVTDWAASGFGQMIGAAFTVIGLIYTIYSILKILGSIFFGCEEEELAFGIQQVNRACHYVGAYCSKRVSFLGFKKCIIETKTHCCFSSPFARIINEQLRLQGIGGDWGTATEPNCEGISIGELETVDWDLVDLSEWEAIMFEAGLVPDPRNPPLNFIPTDLHPGVADGGSEGVSSTDLMQETITTVMPNFDANRPTLEGAPLNQPDPELLPWYDDGLP